MAPIVASLSAAPLSRGIALGPVSLPTAMTGAGPEGEKTLGPGTGSDSRPGKGGSGFCNPGDAIGAPHPDSFAARMLWRRDGYWEEGSSRERNPTLAVEDLDAKRQRRDTGAYMCRPDLGKRCATPSSDQSPRACLKASISPETDRKIALHHRFFAAFRKARTCRR